MQTAGCCWNASDGRWRAAHGITAVMAGRNCAITGTQRTGGGREPESNNSCGPIVPVEVDAGGLVVQMLSARRSRARLLIAERNGTGADSASPRPRSGNTSVKQAARPSLSRLGSVIGRGAAERWSHRDTLHLHALTRHISEPCLWGALLEVYRTLSRPKPLDANVAPRTQDCFHCSALAVACARNGIGQVAQCP